MKSKLANTCFLSAVVVSAIFADLLREVVPVASKLRLLDCIIVVGGMCTLASGTLVPRYKAARWLQVALMAFASYLVLITFVGGILLGEPPLHTLETIAPSIRTVLYAAMFWLSYTAARRGHLNARFVVVVVAVSCLAHGAYATLQFMNQNGLGVPQSFLFWQPVRVTSSGTIIYRHFGATGFTNSVLGLPTIGVTSALLSFGILFAKGSEERNARRLLPHLLSWIGVFAGIAMILMSYRRTALVACTAAILVVAVVVAVKQRRSLPLFLYGAGGAAILFPLVVWVNSSSKNFSARMEFATAFLSGDWTHRSLDSFWARFEHSYATYIELFESHPMGTGVYPPNMDQFIGSDNSYLTYLAQGGIPLLFLFLAVLVGLLYLGYRLLEASNREAASYGAFVLGITVYFGLAGVAINANLVSEMWAVYWCLVGMGVAASSRVMKESNGPRPVGGLQAAGYLNSGGRT